MSALNRLRPRVIGLLLLIFLLGGGVWLLSNRSSLTAETIVSRQAQLEALGLDSNQLFAPGEDPAAEAEALLAQAEFWGLRVAYPTGYFNPAWVYDSVETARRMPTGVPAGIHTLDMANSPLNLRGSGFTALGPQPLQMNGCQSCFAYGLAAGRTNVIVSDPVSPTIAYLGSDGGGVWKTTTCCDANTVWSPTMDDPLISTMAIGDITIDPNDHETIYAGTGDLRYGSWSFGSAGLLRSTDAGANWEILGLDVFNSVYPSPIGEFPQYQAIGKVQVDPRDSDNLVVGTKTGLFFSYDAGANWDGPCQTNSFSSQRQDVTGLLTSDNGASTDIHVAIGTRGFNTTVQPDLDQNGANGLYHTTFPSSGCPASWTLQSNGWPAGTGSGTPFPTNTLGRIDIAMSPSDPDTIYAEVASITTGGLLGVWRTTDGGANWTQRADVNDLNGCFGDWPQNWYDQGLAIDPNDPDNVFMSTVDLFRSTDGGDTFTNLTCGYAGGNEVHVDHHALAFVGGDSDTLLVGTDGGAYVTLDATVTNPSFLNLNQSLNTIEFYSGDITANFATSAEPGITAGAQDNGSSVYVWNGAVGPAEWQMTTGGDGMFARIEPIQEQRWYQESQNAGLKVSQTGPFGTYTNAAGAWGADPLSFVFPYEIYKYNCVGMCEHMIAGTNRVWETIEGAIPANSWYANSPNLTKDTLGDRSFIQQLSFSVTDDSIVIAGTLDGNVWYGFGMGQGVANSATWVNVTDGNSVLPNRPIMDVTTAPFIPTTGFVALGGFDENTPTTTGHVYQVDCNIDCSSFTWTDKSGNLPNVPINSIMVNPRMPDQVFAGSDWGLYYTDDISAANPVWVHFTDGLPNVMIWDMSIDRGFTTLAVFTRSRGAYAWPLPGDPVEPFENYTFLPIISRP